MASDRTLVMVAYDDFQLLDLAGPTEVLDTASSLGFTPGNQRVVVTPNGRPVRSSSGIEVSGDGPPRSAPEPSSSPRPAPRWLSRHDPLGLV